MAKTAKKTAKKAGRKRAGGKGKRYSDSARRKIIAFVEEVNAQKGRGGVAAAARKFDVSPLSIGNWIKQGVVGGAAAGPKRGGRRKASGTGREGVLNDLTEVNRDIAKKRAELDKLEDRFNQLKASL